MLAADVQAANPEALLQYCPTVTTMRSTLMKPAQVVRAKARELRELRLKFAQWYHPEHIFTAALLDYRTTEQLVEFLFYTYGEPPEFPEAYKRNVSKMVRLTMELAGFVNAPTTRRIKSKQEGAEDVFTSLRMWKIPQGMHREPHQVLYEFHLRENDL